MFPITHLIHPQILNFEPEASNVTIDPRLNSGISSAKNPSVVMEPIVTMSDKEFFADMKYFLYANFNIDSVKSCCKTYQIISDENRHPKTIAFVLNIFMYEYYDLFIGSNELIDKLITDIFLPLVEQPVEYYGEIFSIIREEKSSNIASKIMNKFKK